MSWKCRLQNIGHFGLVRTVWETSFSQAPSCIVTTNISRTGLNPLLPTWVPSNHTPGKVWDEIVCPFPNFNGCTVDVWESTSNCFSHFVALIRYKDHIFQVYEVHCGDKMILRPFYLHNGISYTGKMTSLYWIWALVPHSVLQTLTSNFPSHGAFTIHISIWKSISAPWWVYSHTRSMTPRLTNLPISRLSREKHCSMNCFLKVTTSTLTHLT